MATARQEKIAGRARRAARNEFRRFQSLAMHSEHAPTWLHLVECRSGAAIAYAEASSLAQTQHAAGRTDRPWHREGTV